MAFEGTCLALRSDSFSIAVQAAIDDVEKTVDDFNDNMKEDEDTNNGFASQLFHSADDFSSDKAPSTVHASSTGNVQRVHRVLIHWPDDYAQHAGTVKLNHRDGCVTVNYNDCERERLIHAEEN